MSRRGDRGWGLRGHGGRWGEGADHIRPRRLLTVGRVWLLLCASEGATAGVWEEQRPGLPHILKGLPGCLVENRLHSTETKVEGERTARRLLH